MKINPGKFPTVVVDGSSSVALATYECVAKGLQDDLGNVMLTYMMKNRIFL